jgi:transposase-like protein
MKYDKKLCKIAEDVLIGGESLAAVCAELNITRSTLYEWRDTHPEFAQALERGLQKAQREWEKIGQDGASGKIERFNAAALIFTLKNRFRADYAEDKDAKADQNSIIEKLIDKIKD